MDVGSYLLKLNTQTQRGGERETQRDSQTFKRNKQSHMQSEMLCSTYSSQLYDCIMGAICVGSVITSLWSHETMRGTSQEKLGTAPAHERHNLSVSLPTYSHTRLHPTVGLYEVFFLTMPGIAWSNFKD